ncbi:hypothetical protein ACVWXO_000521 [Bradyrhizobium sp. LM2.7]
MQATLNNPRGLSVTLVPGHGLQSRVPVRARIEGDPKDVAEGQTFSFAQRCDVCDTAKASQRPWTMVVHKSFRGLHEPYAGQTRIVPMQLLRLAGTATPGSKTLMGIVIDGNGNNTADLLFLPVNDAGVDFAGKHWSLLFVDRRDPEASVAYHYDSAGQASPYFSHDQLLWDGDRRIWRRRRGAVALKARLGIWF